MVTVITSGVSGPLTLPKGPQPQEENKMYGPAVLWSTSVMWQMGQFQDEDGNDFSPGEMTQDSALCS